MTKFFHHLLLMTLLFFVWSCSTPEETTTKEKVIPDKITMLFVTQPNCPSCVELEKTMALSQPKELIEKYFKIKKIYLGEPIPANLPPVNGTPR